MKDSLVTLICPACGKEMKKLYVKDVDKVVDICLNGCGGIFFDNQELKCFDEENEDINDILLMLANKSFYPVDTTETRICPVCNLPMVKNFTSSTNEIEIDECYTCGGKFLDYGELEKIREEVKHEVDNIDSILINQELELELLKSQRSPLKKFFDEFLWKIEL